MRHYQPIWEKIKKDNSCSITAPRQLHKRIKKAVIKEKDKDLGFKLILSEEGRKALLTTNSQGSILTFNLKFSIGIADL